MVAYSFTGALVIGRDEETSGLVPVVAFAGVLASIIVYRRLQAAAFMSIQLASTLAQVAGRGREVIDGLYNLAASATDPSDRSDRSQLSSTTNGGAQEIRWPRPAAVVQVIDVPRVLRAAERARAVIQFNVGSGEMIAEGAVVAVVRGQAGPRLEREVLKALTVGEERTFEQDPAFALRLLADIALRALSTAVNDPATAAQALDRMDGLLRVLATRDLAIGHVADSDGTTRVELVLPTWEDYLAVALDEIIALPVLSPSVSRRILRLLDELAEITPPSRRSELTARRARLHDPRWSRPGKGQSLKNRGVRRYSGCRTVAMVAEADGDLLAPVSAGRFCESPEGEPVGGLKLAGQRARGCQRRTALTSSVAEPGLAEADHDALDVVDRHLRLVGRVISQSQS